MLGINENKVIVKGKFAKAVRLAAKKSAICPSPTDKQSIPQKSEDSDFHFDWK
jgi:hypothetical protein